MVRLVEVPPLVNSVIHLSHSEGSANPYVKELMTLQRFKEVQGVLHFGHRNTITGKIDPLINLLLKQYQQFWRPGRMLCIDEGMIPFHGSLHLHCSLNLYTGKCRFRMHLPNKPDSTGILAYMLADCDGYLYHFFINEGETREHDPAGLKPLMTVVKLLQVLKSNLPHVIVVDSYFGSERLADVLDTLGYGFVLGCRRDRPSYLWADWLEFQPHAKAEIRFLSRAPGFVALTWNDNNLVHMITNICKGSDFCQAQRHHHPWRMIQSPVDCTADQVHPDDDEAPYANRMFQIPHFAWFSFYRCLDTFILPVIFELARRRAILIFTGVWTPYFYQ